jgi:hypothetical protein
MKARSDHFGLSRRASQIAGNSKDWPPFTMSSGCLQGRRHLFLFLVQICLSWSSAPRHIGCRDRFIGWSAHVRQENLSLIVYNSRFLVLPWVRISHLASHILGRMAKLVPADWERIYNHPIYFLESFVDQKHFRGTCYRAANWILIGETTGRGKNDQTNKPNRSIKAVWGYPLSKNFRHQLSGGTRWSRRNI